MGVPPHELGLIIMRIFFQ